MIDRPQISPKIAVMIGSPIATTVPNANSSTITAMPSPIDLADLGRGLGDLLAQVAAEADGQPGLLGRLRKVGDPLRVIERELARTRLEVERDVADVALLREQRLAAARQRARGVADVRIVLERLDRVVDRRLVLRGGDLHAGGRAQRDRVRAVGLGREPLGEQVGRGLAAGARQREVVVDVGAERAGPAGQRHEDHEPDAEHDPAPPHTEPAQPVQQTRHPASFPFRALTPPAPAAR